MSPETSAPNSTIRIALAGLGTVGMGVLALLRDNQAVIEKRTGKSLQVVAVSARSRSKDRGMDLSGLAWEDDPIALARRDDVDVVLEMVGGETGTALELVETALRSGKSVITANKALLAHDGMRLAQLAEDHGVQLLFEAAVAGGIPAVKGLREGLAGNQIQLVYGILNGTCNYILTSMRETGRGFDAVLAEAQELGYAEAEPSLDVDGYDAAHKLTLLASMAFGTQLDFDKLQVEGIRRISAPDIKIAEELGYRIKLLGLARRLDDGSIEQFVRPVLVPQQSEIAKVEGVFNAVVAIGNFVDEVMMVGRGAGAGPTASAVVGDLIDLARGTAVPTLGVSCKELVPAKLAKSEDLYRAVYLHLSIIDEPGALAKVAEILGRYEISIASLIQREGRSGLPVSLIITTHEARYANVRAARAELDALSIVAEPLHMMIIQEL